MFSSKAQLLKRTPENGTDRENFLSLLVDEYLNSVSFDAKSQVLANLANFAYDPINYGFIRAVGVLDIFIHVLKTESNDKLLHFASSGISNLCPDPLNAEYIITNGGLQPILDLLKNSNQQLVLNAITILYYMNNDQIKAEIKTPEYMRIIKNSKQSSDKRLSNIASIFFDEICHT